MAEIPQKDFHTWKIQNFVRKVRQFVRKYYLIDLPYKLYNFILCHVLLKIALFCINNLSNKYFLWNQSKYLKQQGNQGSAFS